MSYTGKIVAVDLEALYPKDTIGIIISEDTDDYQIAPIVDGVEPPNNDYESIPVDEKDISPLSLKYEGKIFPHKTIWIKKDVCNIIGEARGKYVDKIIRLQIRFMTRTYYDYAHDSSDDPFIPGISSTPVSGRVYGFEEMQAVVDSALDFWLTTGRFNSAFEKTFADFLGSKFALTTNSGSSANLLAVSALTSPKLGDERLRPGDEVITVAAAFPTTVNPILLNHLVPVFVDVDIPTYNIKPDLIERAVSEKTRAILLAHTLGNPFDITEVLRVAQKYDLWVIEDCCDALGSKYSLNPSSSSNSLSEPHLVGTFGHISTFSFYPAHHITMGEGGAVVTSDRRLKNILQSFRDWGRDCWCPPGHENTCGCRFEWRLGNLPKGYDHKYIYSHIGYNLKITDMQAAVGLLQMDRLPRFIRTRRRNFYLLEDGLKHLEEVFIMPKATSHSEPSWFGFPLTLRKNVNFSREKLLHYLNRRKIGTRLLFAGNLIRQPYFENQNYRISDALENSDMIMNNTFWLGIYPGNTEQHIQFIVDSMEAFLRI